MGCRSEYGIPELGWSQGTGSRGLLVVPVTRGHAGPCFRVEFAMDGSVGLRRCVRFNMAAYASGPGRRNGGIPESELEPYYGHAHCLTKPEKCQGFAMQRAWGIQEGEWYST